MNKRNQQQLLLLEDVDNLGRKGELVQGAKPGFIRNFLLPKGRAVIADKRTIRMQERLKEERAKQALVDREQSQVMAGKLKNQTFTHTVKVDGSGHMYGSVSTLDIVHILKDQGIVIDRKMVLLGAPIRALGIHRIPLRLKEGVEAMFSLRVQDEEGKIEAPVAKPSEKEEPATEDQPFAEEQDAAVETETENAGE